MDDVKSIADSLGELDKERLLGWQGPPGAAYNVVSEDLCEIGLLKQDWSLSELGLAVRQHLLDNAK